MQLLLSLAPLPLPLLLPMLQLLLQPLPPLSPMPAHSSPPSPQPSPQLSPQPSLAAVPLPLPLLPPAPPPLPQPPLSARAHALTSALTFQVISATDDAIAVPLPPLNVDADAAVAASPVIAVINCRPYHFELIVASAIFPHCPCLDAALLLPLVATIKYHSSPPFS
jgi:hypothetical protein